MQAGSGILLDTVALYRLLNGDITARSVLNAIRRAEERKALYVSVVTPVEVSLAAQKRNASRMELNGLGPISWCSSGVRNIGARWVGIGGRVGLSATETPSRLGHRDPCDALIVATAHVRRLSLITADERILALAGREPGYLRVLAC